MRDLLNFYLSSAGKKLLMGLTGLFLLSFLSVHLYVNLFLFMGDGGSTYDTYAEFMGTYPLIRPLEIGLFLGFLLHALLGVILWYRNWRVRPQGYAVDNTGKAATLVSRYTIVTGSAVLVFLVYHIKVFFVVSRFMDTGKTMTQLVTETFKNPWVVGFYLTALFFLGAHLKHAFQSAFQTFGLRNPKYQTLIDCTAVIFWLLFPLLFAAIPIYMLYQQRGVGL